MSDLDPIISTAKAATQSIKSAIESGREVSSAVESIQNFGMAEVKARHAFKAVRSRQEGEITIMTAMAEWRRLDQIRRMELPSRRILFSPVTLARILSIASMFMAMAMLPAY